ncbi:MAG: hypothetical protein K6B74_06350 [Ruminococcus sp.]|nr:hypothetical protein [Ruminococcus sp.]
MTELERLDHAEELFKRYELKEAKITQNKENQAYLQTLIHDDVYVQELFDMKSRLTRDTGIAGGGALVVFLIVLIISRTFLVSLGIAAFVFIGAMAFFISFNRYKLDQKMEKQSETNEWIIDEIERLRNLEPEIVKLKEDYVKGLDEEVPFISLSDEKYLTDLREYIETGEADTCEDAAGILEQKLLLQQLNSLMENHEIERNYIRELEEHEKERFNNPLESIKPSTKKSLKERIFGKRLKKKKKSYFDELDDNTVDPYSPEEIMKYVNRHSKHKKKR